MKLALRHVHRGPDGIFYAELHNLEVVPEGRLTIVSHGTLDYILDTAARLGFVVDAIGPGTGKISLNAIAPVCLTCGGNRWTSGWSDHGSGPCPTCVGRP